MTAGLLRRSDWFEFWCHIAGLNPDVVAARAARAVGASNR